MLTDEDKQLTFFNTKERTIFTKLRDWWLRGGANVARAILTGEGTPQGNVAAPVGSLFLRSDGGANTTLYIKESGTGNTGWVAK